MLTDKQTVRFSKFLSLVLRHKPELIGIQLDANGWTDVADLLRKAQQHGVPIDAEILDYVVANNNKNRFALSPDKKKIRANQGHSVAVELGYEAQEPPEILYHGTGSKYVDSILKSGLIKKDRHHVHLSADTQTATQVGQRHGKPVIFEVLAGQMHRTGFQFFLSENGVWLTDAVPVQFLIKLPSLRSG